jgi:hypothetical protein
MAEKVIIIGAGISGMSAGCYLQMNGFETEIFESRFFVLITEAEKKTSGEQGERKKPASKDPGDDTHGLHGLNLPNVIRVYEDEWDRYGFDRYDALHISKASEDNYDFFVNVDNWHLKTEQKGKTKTDPRILEARYMYGHVIIALALITDHKEDEDQITTIEELVQRVSRAISPFILPMVEELGSLELQDVALDTFERDPSNEEPEIGSSIRKQENNNTHYGVINEHNFSRKTSFGEDIPKKLEW